MARNDVLGPVVFVLALLGLASFIGLMFGKAREETEDQMRQAFIDIAERLEEMQNMQIEVGMDTIAAVAPGSFGGGGPRPAFDAQKHMDELRAQDPMFDRFAGIMERMQEQIERGTKLIDTTGERVGQINGLSVTGVGKFAFGVPSRITARVRIGKGEVVDIEREVELGGPIHSKGVLILSSFLGSRYAADRPLSLYRFARILQECHENLV